jgi:hypothetical protein
MALLQSPSFKLYGDVCSNIVTIKGGQQIVYFTILRGIPSIVKDSNPTSRSKFERQISPFPSSYARWSYMGTRVISPCGNFACLGSGSGSECVVIPLSNATSRFSVKDDKPIRVKDCIDDFAFCSAVPGMMAFATSDGKLTYGNMRSRTVHSEAGQPMFSNSGDWLVCTGAAPGKPLVLHSTKSPKDYNVATRGNHPFYRCAAFLSSGETDLLAVFEQNLTFTVSRIEYWTSTDTVTLVQTHGVLLPSFESINFYCHHSGPHLLLSNRDTRQWSLYNFALASHQCPLICEKRNLPMLLYGACFSNDQCLVCIAFYGLVEIYSTRTTGEPLFRVNAVFDASPPSGKWHMLPGISNVESLLFIGRKMQGVFTRDDADIFNVPNMHARMLILASQFAAKRWPLPPATDVSVLVDGLRLE